MLERRIENKLVNEVEGIGGQCLKLNSQSANGIPDRLVLMPEGKIYFVELKRPGEPLRDLQIYWQSKLHKLGFMAIKIDSVKAVDLFIEMIKGGGLNHG